jgi:N,N'-diacetylchitobiose non-reducing end deacetylase
MSPAFTLEIPNLYDAKKILAIQPHYDDNDIPAGGTLAALADAGIEIVYLTCSDDQMGVIDEKWSFAEADARLKKDQGDAAQILGVKRQHWLGYPDAGEYNYFDLRRNIMRVMRMESPDYVITVDPWLAYEAHNDHIIAGKAAAEAAILCGLKRIHTDPDVDAAYEPHEIKAVAFYNTQYPNTCFDISSTIERKLKALRCYRAQFREEEMEMLVGYAEFKAGQCAVGQPFKYAELWKVVTPRLLHGFTETWKF